MAKGVDEAGRRLFSRYAHAPNSLGYCGPADSAALRAVACGGGDPGLVPGLAAGFSGAWPYQELIAAMTGRADPLAADVVRAYWTGNDLTAEVDRADFGAALLDRFGPQAASYWTHLDESVLVEAAPTHAFHVFSIYPWTRLLGTGRPEPLEVLDSCRIAQAEVVEVGPEQLVVRSRHLEYRDRRLSLGEPVESRVEYLTGGGSFLGEVSPGDRVALHWGFACDLLTSSDAAHLQRWTDWQLDAVAPRLSA
ncbi:MAG: DUF6390 family protein [Nocardioides sp.]|nr:DUF6390 family protein [Nocardioides sp.]